LRRNRGKMNPADERTKRKGCTRKKDTGVGQNLLNKGVWKAKPPSGPKAIWSKLEGNGIREKMDVAPGYYTKERRKTTIMRVSLSNKGRIA